MANYPTSLDSFTNPTSVDSLNSPSHSLQHADANDAIEALEAKLGIGASSAGSAVSGYVLTAGTGGTTTWSDPARGLTQIIPATVTKGASGTASISSGGAVTFSTTESISLNTCFTSTYDHYLIKWVVTTKSADSLINCRFRASGTDNTSSNYKYTGSDNYANGSTSLINSTGTTAFRIAYVGTNEVGFGQLEVFSPATSNKTSIISNFSRDLTSDLGREFFNGAMTVTTAYDGISLYCASGTFSGVLRVYGYRNG